jgi:hypothetical protein
MDFIKKVIGLPTPLGSNLVAAQKHNAPHMKLECDKRKAYTAINTQKMFARRWMISS